MLLILSALLGYLLGSISNAVIISRTRGTDVRTLGSGNAGATNMLRNFGKGAAATVFLLDIAKGVLAVLLGRLLAGEYGGYLGGFMSIIGHNFPVYFGFRGGKGITTSLAVMLTVAPGAALPAFVIAIVVMAVTKYVSLGSILGAFFFGVLALFRSEDIWFSIFAVATSILAIARHAGNIKRLINGTERKLGQ